MRKVHYVFGLSLLLVIVIFVSIFGLRDLLHLPDAPERMYQILCFDNPDADRGSAYLVHYDDFEFRYDGAKRVLIVRYEDSVINCGIDYFIEEVHVRDGAIID